jgi:VWFA-related protein
MIRFILCGLIAGTILATTNRAPAAPQGTTARPEQAPAPSPEVIKAESAVVLVDVVATDKKGHHVSDLELKDFRVYDDDQEQAISSFNHVVKEQAGTLSGPPRYVVLFFDDSTMNPADQIQARKAAGKFVEKTASKERMMAVVDFGGATRVAQNFTADPPTLQHAIQGVKFGTVQPNEPGQSTDLASLGPVSMTQIRTDYAARTVLLALRSLAQPAVHTRTEISDPFLRWLPTEL